MKIGKMAPKMPWHKTRIEREITKIETCIKDSKEAREKKDGQAVNQHNAELEVHKDYLEEMKSDLLEDYNEQEVEAYEDLDEKIRDAALKIVSEISRDDYYLDQRTKRLLGYKLEKINISKYREEFSEFHNWSSQFLTYTDGLDNNILRKEHIWLMH